MVRVAHCFTALSLLLAASSAVDAATTPIDAAVCPGSKDCVIAGVNKAGLPAAAAVHASPDSE